MKNRKIQQHTSILWLLFGVFMCAVISTSAADEVKMGEVPKEVYDVIDEYLKDTTGPFSFNKNREFCHIKPAIKFSDIKAGTPIQICIIPFEVLMNTAESSSISEIAKPINKWYVPISAHGKLIYFIWVRREEGVLRVVAITEGMVEVWKKIRAAWPESSGYNPVIIYSYNNWPFIHIPEVDNYNLTYLRLGSQKDSLSMISPRTFNELSNSRVVLRYIKKEVVAHQKYYNYKTKENENDF